MNTPVRLALALACTFAASALAQDAVKSTNTNISTAPVIKDEAQIKALQAFWTPERLAAAKPMPIPRVDPSTVVPSNTPVAPGPVHFQPGILPAVHTEAAPVPEERFPLNQGPDTAADATPSPDGFTYEMPFNNYRTGINNQFPYSTMGKLFFSIPTGASEPAGEYVCSATVINNSYTVITARHCVFDYVKSKWYSNWVFYPEWNNGASGSVGGKSGAWYPEQVATFTGSSTLSLTTGYDIAMMLMHDSAGTGCKGNKGKTIAYYTGALGWVYGGSNAQSQWNIFGYPQASPFEGNYLYQDNGATGALDPEGTSNIIQVGNPQTGGTSGGPWIIGFNPNNATDPNPNNNFVNGNNYINGLNSFQWTTPSQPYAINGPAFQSFNFDVLLNYTEGLTCN